MADTCNTCTYWKNFAGQTGECRQSPPGRAMPTMGAMGMPGSMPGSRPMPGTQWPVTQYDDFCGAFSARP